jgi:ribonuclease J
MGMRSANRLTVFDGASSIGGSKILLETRGTGLLLDFGTNYQTMSRYYEEYLKPRPSRGLTDYLEIGLLPARHGWYRRDLFPPYDYPTLDEGWPGVRPAAVLVTHGHLDHCGAIAFLDPSIPVVSSPMTLALLRAWQEGGPPDLPSEVTYYGMRSPADDGARPGDSLSGRRLESDRDAPKRGRPFRLLGETPAALRAEIRRSPFGGKTVFEPDDPVPAGRAIEGVPVEAFEVDHSVYGATGFLLEADGALVAYTGDLRFHGSRGAQTEAFVRRLEARRPELLVVEGTRLRAPGEEAPQSTTTEDEVERRCQADVEGRPGRLVVADFGPRNVERLRRFRRIAEATGRTLVLVPKDAFLLHMLHTVDPSIEADLTKAGMRILEEPSTAFPKAWLWGVLKRNADAFVNPHDIAKAPGHYLLCFSFLDCNDLVDLKRERATEGGLWIYSSSEAHGEEQEFDFHRLEAWIRWAGMEKVGFRHLPDGAGGSRLSFEHPEDTGRHASGHATEAELVELIARANPRYLVPVHTVQKPERYEALLKARGLEVRVLPASGGAAVDW